MQEAANGHLGRSRPDRTRHYRVPTRGTHKGDQGTMGVERNSQGTASPDRTIDKGPQQISVRGCKTKRASIASPTKCERSNPQKPRIPPEARGNPPSVK